VLHDHYLVQKMQHFNGEGTGRVERWRSTFLLPVAAAFTISRGPIETSVKKFIDQCVAPERIGDVSERAVADLRICPALQVD
jgi:hypothetical protein